MTLFPPYFNLFDYFLGDERLLRIGRDTALEFCGSLITYEELRREVDFWTEQIISCGIAEGDRVALMLYDSPEFVATFLATASIGAVCVPINTFLSQEDVLFIISDCDARLVIVEDELEWKVSLSHSSMPDTCSIIAVDSITRHYLEPKDEAAVRPSFPATTREAPAFLLYTSGSTGTPKGVLHSHGAIPSTVETYARNVLELARGDRIYSASRMFFAYGLGNSLSFPLAAGATTIIEAQRPTAERVAKLFEEQLPSIFFGVPAIYRALLDRRCEGTRLDTTSLRLCISAGEALPARIFEEWKREFGLEILDGIGSTEMLHIFISNRAREARAGTSGREVEGYSARLLDDAHDEVASGCPGNLYVRGDSAMLGYWGRPDLTQNTMSGGWVKTGDIYERDGEGYFHHVGRSDDCFKVRGLWVSPIEVESILLAHEEVTEAAVVSGMGDDGLATVRAFVVIRSNKDSEALREELREFACSRLPQHKTPSEIIFLKELPRTSTGKVQRYKLRAEGRKSGPGGY